MATMTTRSFATVARPGAAALRHHQQQQVGSSSRRCSERSSRRRCVAAAAAASSSSSAPAFPLPGPQTVLARTLAYARAVTDVAARRLADAALDAAADISICLAEQPQRLQELAAEIQAAAERELHGGGQQGLLSSSSSSSASGSGSSSGDRSSSSSLPDLEATVDELRADIAACRSLLQQIRSGSPPPAPAGGASSR